ncbi:MAG: hypothetical protein CK552_01290 [Actinobacteria bacterium]|nr:MAG: hypothetical protein CK552_01290 [Actinomycetota bacterium]
MVISASMRRPLVTWLGGVLATGRVARLPAAADELAGAPERKPEPVDQGLDSWQSYVADLHRLEPPGS